MKKIYTTLLLLLIMSVCGCTQNDGHIGPIFGSWSLMEISKDGVPLELNKETVFSFQNEVVRISQVSEDPYAGETRYGNFTKSDKVLTLKFLSELTPEGSGYTFLMPNWLYFPEGVTPLDFEIKELNGKRMVLVLDYNGEKLTYKFEKTW